MSTFAGDPETSCSSTGTETSASCAATASSTIRLAIIRRSAFTFSMVGGADSPYAFGQYCGGKNAETTRTPVPRRAACSIAWDKAASDSADPSTPTTTLARSLIVVALSSRRVRSTVGSRPRRHEDRIPSARLIDA
jgi:hypothetical protein